MLYLNGQPIPEHSNLNYLRVLVNLRWNMEFKSVIVDIGQKNYKDFHITDEDNNKLTFNSEVDVMNFIYAHGWELVQVYNLGLNNSGTAYQSTIIFKKMDSSI